MYQSFTEDVVAAYSVTIIILIFALVIAGFPG